MFAVVILCIALWTSTASAQVQVTCYNTAQNVAIGSVDPNYQYVGNDHSCPLDNSFTHFGSPSSMYAIGNIVPGGWVAAAGSSNYISIAQNGQATNPQCMYISSTCYIASSCGIPSDLNLVATVTADNAADIIVNGNFAGGTVFPYGFQQLTTVSIPASSLVVGNNNILIRMREYTTGSSPSGVAIAWNNPSNDCGTGTTPNQPFCSTVTTDQFDTYWCVPGNSTGFYRCLQGVFASQSYWADCPLGTSCQCPTGTPCPNDFGSPCRS